MFCALHDWYVTVLVTRDRTMDVIVRARNAYSAAWIYRRINPGIEVLCVRPVLRTVLRTNNTQL